MPTLRHLRCVIALLLTAAFYTSTHAHEMDGIDHAHLANGMVQIIEPIPGGQSTSAVRSEKAEAAGVAPKSAQPSGAASLFIQLGLIVSAIVLMVVAVRASALKR